MPDDLTFTQQQFENLGRTDRDQYSFALDEDGKVIRRTSAKGTFTPTGLQNSFRVRTETVTDTAAAIPASVFTNRNAISIYNKSNSTTIYFGPDTTVTADDHPTTGGWEVGPGEFLNFDITDDITLYAIAPAGLTATVKILEIA